jgi:ATP-dependent Lon protease
VTGIVSALTRRKVRRDVAMTVEVTLLGRVLPIGGLKEKVMADRRGELKTLIIPQENEKDLKDIPDRILKTFSIISVKTVDHALQTAMLFREGETLFRELDPAETLPTPAMLSPKMLEKELPGTIIVSPSPDPGPAGMDA